ncbi:diguanylate cyclase [Mycobacterium sp. OAE908]|uniref:diguanylate cyclase domain-containing protein n=1 Tax=Mycobacterium sp. OAE908 TaxID=2817899 RepID=UPI001AE26A84
MEPRGDPSAVTRSAVPARRLRIVAAAYFGALIVTALWLWQKWGGAFATRVVDDVGSLLGILFAAACAVWAVRSLNGRARNGWRAMAFGLFAWAIGESIWGYYEVVLRYEQSPSPSLADVFYLMYPVGAGVAVVLLSTAGTNRWRVRLILDGVIVAASLFLVSWVSVIEGVFHAGGDSHLALAVSLAYPIADVVVITIAWSSAVVAYRPSIGLLLAGLIIVALTDSVFTGLTAVDDYYTGNLIDLGWMAGCGVLGLAALRSIGESPQERTRSVIPPRARLWLPYLPLVLAAAVAMAKILPGLNSLPFAAVVLLLVIAVLTRQFVALAENQQLLSDVGRLAFADQLTGLANRALFIDHLEQALKRQQREPLTLTVLCLDLDGFKAVNDQLGHPAGDELLVRVADRLSASVRNTDTVARLGGDEFAILIEGPVEDTVAAAERILNAFGEPIVVDGVPLPVRPSIGLTMATADMPRTSVSSLIRQADLAMYAAKRDGGGCLRSFVPDLPDPYELPRRFPTFVEPPGEPDVPATADSDAEEIVASPPVAVPERPPWPPVGVRIALAVLLTGLAVFALSTLLRERPGRIPLFDSWLESTLLLSAAGMVAVRSWRIASERWAWLFIAVGMTATGLATVVYAIWVPEGKLPSVADPLFLAFYPPVFIGVVLLIRRRLRYLPRAIRFDVVMVGLTVATLAVAVALGPIRPATTGQLTTVVVGLAYPIGSLVLVALTAGSLSIVGWRAEPSWALVAAGLVLFATANTIYLYEVAHHSYLEGTFLDTCWSGAFVLIAAGAWVSQTHTVPRPNTSRAPLLLPVACTIAALGVTVLANGDRLPMTLAALTLTFVAARFAITFRDSSAMAESHHQTMTDQLTGLANRLAVATALTAATFDQPDTPRWDRRGAKLGLVLLSLDQFHEITSSLGRHVSDELLYRIANRLSQSIRQADLVARVGDYEFAVLLHQADLTTTRAQAGALMDALRAPFALDHITVQVDASIGVSLWPDNCAHPQELLTCAEMAMSHAKTTTSRIAVYNAVAQLHTNSDGQFIADLRSTLSTDAPNDSTADSRRDGGRDVGELTCYYQPKINARDDSVHSVEALVRWRHPTRGLLLPDQFLPAAEHAGLMRPVAARVLDMALTQIRSWRDRDIALTVAVNLSTTNLLDLGLVDTIAQLLRSNGLPPESLILEITESTLTTDSQRARNTVAALRRLGTRLSLDDYGTGWSSLARLQDLSVDELKLDRVFVARLALDPRSIAIVRSTVALAHSLGADLVAEGVEDTATLRALRQYGCNITQGNVHSPPLSSDDFRRWLIAHPSALSSARAK